MGNQQQSGLLLHIESTGLASLHTNMIRETSLPTTHDAQSSVSESSPSVAARSVAGTLADELLLVAIEHNKIRTA